jgi:phage terminase large subunit GpA-like protein
VDSAVAELDLELDDASDFREAWRAMAPTEHPRLLLWSIRDVVTHVGEPYDHDRFPHIGAPGGPADAFDDYAVREIILQWASRLGKTFFGQMCTLYNGVQLRLPQIFGSTNESLALDVVARTYAMIRKSPLCCRALTKSERMQQQHLIEFKGCSVYVGWARSAATFADKDCHGGHTNETDDWEHLSTAKDGDPLDQFMERFKDHQGTRKVVIESIPKIRGKSRVERKRKQGWQCEYHVPCPHCRKFQILEWGTKDSKHGFKWEQKDGNLHAWYSCFHCNEKIENHHRRAMMRRGVWVPEGCAVKHEEAWKIDSRSPDYKWEGWAKATWVEGKPVNNSEIASYRAASYIAVSLTWTECVKKFLDCKNHPQKLRNFKNQWDGNTWEIRKSRSEPTEIQKRIATEFPKWLLPEWTEFITLGADRQRADGGYVVYRVLAHGPDEMVHIVDWGFSPDLDTMWLELGKRHYYKPDGTPPLRIVAAAIDSGWDPDTTYKFCKKHPECVPCKGGNTKETESYKWTDFDESKYDTEGLSLLLISTEYTETSLQHRLDACEPCKPFGLSACVEFAADLDCIEDLTNAVLADKVDAKGSPVLLWVKKDESVPNDGRDATRYGIEIAAAYRDQIRGEGIADNQVSIESRPDGRKW